MTGKTREGCDGRSHVELVAEALRAAGVNVTEQYAEPALPTDYLIRAVVDGGIVVDLSRDGRGWTLVVRPHGDGVGDADLSGPLAGSGQMRPDQVVRAVAVVLDEAARRWPR